MSDDNMTRFNKYLFNKYQIRSNDRIKVNENSKTIQTVSITKSVL